MFAKWQIEIILVISTAGCAINLEYLLYAYFEGFGFYISLRCAINTVFMSPSRNVLAVSCAFQDV